MKNLTETMREWRHELHQIPELGFEVFCTAKYITQKLQAMGRDVVTGIGKTGLVGTLVRGEGSTASVAIRADMDALAIHECPDSLPYSSELNIMLLIAVRPE
ncbi:hypothetical protein [Pseudomonas putida]|uniref:hypothetical protein n=1 Tax=Pseudomonas putida TaxID=303 RepID=UPI00300F70CA